MVIEIIPAGSSAVVTDSYGHHGKEHHDDKAVELMGAIKSAEADLERSAGQHFGNLAAYVKDAEADLERSSGQHYGNLSSYIKDAEAQLERSVGSAYADTVKTMKDAEANLERSYADKTMNVIQDVKDAEARMTKDAGDKFINTIHDIRDFEARSEKNSGDRFIHTIEDVKDASERSTLNAWKVSDLVKENKFESEKGDAKTREFLLNGFKETLVDTREWIGQVKHQVAETNKEILVNQLKEFKQTELNMFKLAAEADKTACANQTLTLLQFKDAAHQADKLAATAAAQLAECCCEIKSLVVADGNTTRALINANETQNLRDRAARAESQLAAYFARGVAPIVP